MRDDFEKKYTDEYIKNIFVGCIKCPNPECANKYSRCRFVKTIRHYMKPTNYDGGMAHIIRCRRCNKYWSLWPSGAAYEYKEGDFEYKEGEGMTKKELDELKKSKEKDIEARLAKIEEYLANLREEENTTPLQFYRWVTWKENESIDDFLKALKSKKE